MEGSIVEGVAGRLRDSIPEDGIREFQRQIEDRGVRGSSYAQVHRYLGGEAVPPLEFLEAAAEILEKRPAWLIADAGAPTEEKERHRQAEERASAGVEELEDVGVREGFGPGTDTLLDSGLRRALLAHLRRRLIFTKRGQEAFLDGTLGERIGSALAGPIAAFDVDPGDLPSDALADYLQAMTAALRALCPEPPEPNPSIRQEDDHATE